MSVTVLNKSSQNYFSCNSIVTVVNVPTCIKTMNDNLTTVLN